MGIYIHIYVKIRRNKVTKRPGGDILRILRSKTQRSRIKRENKQLQPEHDLENETLIEILGTVRGTERNTQQRVKNRNQTTPWRTW